MDLPQKHGPRPGDRAAFEQLYDDHARGVYAHALRMTGSWSTAEDVVSLTFLEAWRLRHKLGGEVVSPRLWLLGIATNVLRNTARAARRHRDALARMPPHEDVPDFADALAGRMADSRRLAAALRAVGRLRRKDREVLMLCVWSGLGYAEAAAVLGIPVGTVRSRLSRARDRLRRLALEELDGPGTPDSPGAAPPADGPRTGEDPARRPPSAATQTAGRYTVRDRRPRTARPPQGRTP